MKIAKVALLLILLSRATHAFSQGTWQLIPAAPVAGRFDDMYFINDSTGFIAQDGNVFQTTDKGNTWNLISTLDSSHNTYYVRSIEFLNDSVGFAGLLYSGSPLLGNLFKTTDGGHSCTLLQNMDIAPFDGICGMAHFKNSLCAVGTWSGPAWFYRSNNLGKTWKKVDLSSFATGLVDCYMLNKDTILVSGISDSLNDLKATILKSYDGGKTWQRVYLSPNPSSYCWKLFFRPNGLGLASVEFGNPVIARTTDNGTTWTTQQVYDSYDSDLGGIGLLNDTLGWVMDQHGFGTWETHDGGLTWKNIPSQVIEGDRMVILDSATALICGESVYKYVYGTVTSIQQTSSSNQQIHELNIFPNPAHVELTIEAKAGTNTMGILDILDEKGSVVKHIARQPFRKGSESFIVNIKNLSAGNYRVLWRTNELFLTKPFVIAR